MALKVLSAKSETTKELIAEAGDSINAQIAEVPPKRTVKDFAALAIATCGVGYMPIAPGTWGSAVGVGLYLLISSVFWSMALPLAHQHNFVKILYVAVTLEFLIIVCITLVGIWAASRTEKLSGKKDPGKVVIDEVAGQLIALSAIPLWIHAWSMIVLAFLLFRLFDIIKPYPCRRLESLPSGLGIMADDVVAGVYAALVVAVVSCIRF